MNRRQKKKFRQKFYHRTYKGLRQDIMNRYQLKLLDVRPWESLHNIKVSKNCKHIKFISSCPGTFDYPHMSMVRKEVISTIFSHNKKIRSMKIKEYEYTFCCVTKCGDVSLKDPACHKMDYDGDITLYDLAGVATKDDLDVNISLKPAYSAIEGDIVTEELLNARNNYFEDM